MSDNERLTTLTEGLSEAGSTVAKDLRNDHAGYEYASADAIYKHVRDPLLATGLLPYQTELSKIWHERGSAWWLEVEYGLALTTGGVPPAHDGLERVTVLVRVMGSQSLGAARTYALKYWLRGKLLLATGDQAEDLDAAPAEPPGKRPVKEMLAAKRAAIPANNSWSDDDRKDLMKMLIDWAQKNDWSQEKLNQWLVHKYGTANPKLWSDEQIEGASEGIIKAHGKAQSE